MFINDFVNVENMYVECLNSMLFMMVNVRRVIRNISEYDVIGFWDIFMFFVNWEICLLNFKM